MQAWLEHNRQQYQFLMALWNFLIARGFNPVPTPPAHDREFRQDHTQAILELLSSFRPESIEWPLSVFSTGPLYQPRAGRWLETIDVEILGASPRDDDRQALELIGELVPTLAPEGVSPACLMVFGHVGWLDQVLGQLGLSPEQRQDLRRLFMDGNLVEAEQQVAQWAPEAKPLFVPQSTEDFFPRLAKVAPWVNGDPDPSPLLPDTWAVEWDLSLTGTWPYYTGLVFSLFLPGIGQPLLNGGRFSWRQAGRLWQGVGFTLYLEPLLAYAELSRRMEAGHA